MQRIRGVSWPKGKGVKCPFTSLLSKTEVARDIQDYMVALVSAPARADAAE